MKQLKAVVLSNEQVLSYPGAEYFLMRLEAPEIAQESKPGQFLMLKCSNDTILRRPISVHAVTNSGEAHLLYAVQNGFDLENTARGKGTRWLSGLTKGSELDVIGPLGNGFKIEPSAKSILLVAGGIGIAPLKFLAEKAISMNINVILLSGARTGIRLLPENMFPARATTVFATDDGSRGKKAAVIDLIPEYLERVDQVLACGPEDMFKALSHRMESWPVTKPVQVSLEVRMGCGVGACYACSVITRQGKQRVCQEGPVFNIRDIIWQEVRI